MRRTTVFLPEPIECDLKALARQQNRTVADMVREALDEYVTRQKERQVRSLGFVGVGKSGRSDTAERHESLLFTDALAAGRPPRRTRTPRKSR
jgi:hypothetical protein